MAKRDSRRLLLNRKSGRCFFVVDLLVRNNDRTASTLPPLKLVDTQGREYDESSTLMPGSFSPFKKLNPTVSSQGYVVFDAPRGTYKLKLSGGYESGETALINLATANQAPQAAQ